MRHGDDPIPLTSSLDAVMRSLDGGDRRRVRGVFGQWEDAVGPTISAHARPVRLDEGTLLVEVDEPAWATQIELLADDVRRRLAEVADVEVRRIEVRVARSRR